MDKLFECVPFSSALAESNDEERFKLIIQEAIDNGVFKSRYFIIQHSNLHI